MVSRFKTVTIEEVTKLKEAAEKFETLSTGMKNSKGIFCEETLKIKNFSKNVCFKRKLYSS